MTNFAARCESRSNPSAKQCTKERGHDGPHFSAEMFVSWTNDVCDNQDPYPAMTRAAKLVEARANDLRRNLGRWPSHEELLDSFMLRMNKSQPIRCRDICTHMHSECERAK